MTMATLASCASSLIYLALLDVYGAFVFLFYLIPPSEIQREVEAESACEALGDPGTLGPDPRLPNPSSPTTAATSPCGDIAHDFALIGTTGTGDPLPEGCGHRRDARWRQCGIFTGGGVPVGGAVFRQLTDKEMVAAGPRFFWLGPSPWEKIILAPKLRLLGEIAGITGGGTKDQPALKSRTTLIS
ncbi:hypothetical protein F5I97DRAFT_1923085 [Phlebopus sp. FC_14]|nr:hypothetical protein F5I97DRAFT_1923085 [Phlebopus sp. FC_14]